MFLPSSPFRYSLNREGVFNKRKAVGDLWSALSWLLRFSIQRERILLLARMLRTMTQDLVVAINGTPQERARRI